MPKMLRKVCYIGAVVLALSIGSSAMLLSVNIARMGVQNTTLYIAFATTPSGPLGPCAYGNLYLAKSSGYLETAMSIALTAKATGAPLTRIDYTQASDGTCYIDLIET